MEQALDHLIIWEKALEFARSKSNSLSYNTTFKHLRPLGIEGNVFILECKDSFQRGFAEGEREILEKSLADASFVRFKIRFVLPESEPVKPQPLEKDGPSQKNNLNADFTFESFVVGAGNKFAYNVCLSVVTPPKNTKSKNMFNPLFLYGGSGLGKTHLLQAIGNEILNRYPNKKVVYTQCETFLNEFISSLSSKSFEPFRKKFRSCDYLLIDDIQFLENKEGTQEEFFHTFNTLFEKGSQIVLTCDKPPAQLNSMEERLITRFQSGVLVDVQAPDYETRVAILRNMAQSNHVIFPDEVIDYIANNISSNVRELEGAFKKVMAYTLLQGEVNLTLTSMVLQDMISPQNARKITPDLILNVIASFYNITQDDLLSPRRDNHIAYPRMIAMYFFRTTLDMTLGKISEFFGKKDHTTARSACNKIDIIVKEKKAPFCDEIEELRKRIAL